MKAKKVMCQLLLTIAALASFNSLQAAYGAPTLQSPPQMSQAAPGAPAAQYSTDQEQLNVQLSAQAADQWLRLMDEGKYGDSWDAASNIFRFTIKRDEWIKAQEKLRQPLGQVISRKLVEQRVAKDPKGLPQGDYMVLYYKTQFANRPNASELITMVLSTDGKWKVLTYHSS